MEDDVGSRRRQLIVRGATFVCVICAWMMVRFRRLANSRPAITYGLWVLGKRSARATLDSSTIQMIPNVLSSLGWEGCLSSSCVTCSAIGASWETPSTVILRNMWQCSYMWSATMRRLGASSSHSVDLLKLSVCTSKRFCMLLENSDLKLFCLPQPMSPPVFRTAGAGIHTSRLTHASLA